MGQARIVLNEAANSHNRYPETRIQIASQGIALFA